MEQSGISLSIFDLNIGFKRLALPIGGHNICYDIGKFKRSATIFTALYIHGALFQRHCGNNAGCEQIH